MNNLIIIENGAAVLAQEAMDKIAALQKKQKEIEQALQDIKDDLKDEMEEHGILKIDMQAMAITYVPETTAERLDTKELKKDLPQIYNTYVKESKKSAYIKITVRE